jgi:hypothetical protein
MDFAMSDPALIRRRANLSRPYGSWSETDYDVFDGDRNVTAMAVTRLGFGGVSFQLTGRKSYGHVSTLNNAKAAFKAEHVSWKGTG